MHKCRRPVADGQRGKQTGPRKNKRAKPFAGAQDLQQGPTTAFAARKMEGEFSRAPYPLRHRHLLSLLTLSFFAPSAAIPAFPVRLPSSVPLDAPERAGKGNEGGAETRGWIGGGGCSTSYEKVAGRRRRPRRRRRRLRR